MPHPKSGKRLTLHPPRQDAELDRLLEEARQKPAMTDAEVRQQITNVAPYGSSDEATHYYFATRDM